MSKPIFQPASAKQALMVQRAADTQILVIGGAAGSGKSHILNNLPLLVLDDPNSNCILYRRTNPQLEGGLWPNGRDIYANSMPKGMKPRIREQKKEIIFPNGAKIKYQQAENTARAKDDAQGQEFTLIGIDEACQHDWEFLEYLMSRLRSKSKHFSRLVMSCNPDPDHKIRELISWYIGDDGFPIPEREGVIRYFIKQGDLFIWGDTREELGLKYDIPEEDWEGKILSFSHVSGLVYDNPFMLEHNKSYVAFLEGLNEVDKAQLLYGNWDARLKGANYWERDWVERNIVDRLPYDCIKVRPYDLASTERSQANKTPDPTACIGMAKGRSDGKIYLYGHYHEETYDEELQVYGQFCKRSGARDEQIIKQAEYDGEDTFIVLPQDPAASGAAAFDHMAKMFTEAGFVVKKDPMPINKSKLTKFTPFASACELGLVYIVKSSFDKQTLDHIYKQLEMFNGERSTSTRKDEFPDLCGSGFNYLQKARVHRPMRSATNTSTTALSDYKKTVR